MGLAKKFLRGSAVLGAGVALLAVAVTSASAFNPRVPQVAVLGGTLQTYLNGVDGGINVNTDQVDAQVWTVAASGNASFTLMIELTANSNANALGVYNAGLAVPALDNVFPAAATAGWFASAHFSGGNLVVTLFDQNSTIQGQVFYANVPANNFGFYLTGPGGTFYSQDSRNAGGAAKALTYLGTGVNAGDWWECFEDKGGAATDNDFDDAVLELQSVVPTPTAATTWGRMKSLYRH